MHTAATPEKSPKLYRLSNCSWFRLLHDVADGSPVFRYRHLGLGAVDAVETAEKNGFEICRGTEPVNGRRDLRLGDRIQGWRGPADAGYARLREA